MNNQSGFQVSGTGAQMYQRYATQYMGQWAPELIEVAALQPGARVLDLASGTGQVARHAVARVGLAGQVTGLDINAEMLAVARAMPSNPGAIAALSAGDRAALARQVKTALQPYAEGAGVAYPDEDNIVAARRS